MYNRGDKEQCPLRLSYPTDYISLYSRQLSFTHTRDYVSRIRIRDAVKGQLYAPTITFERGHLRHIFALFYLISYLCPHLSIYFMAKVCLILKFFFFNTSIVLNVKIEWASSPSFDAPKKEQVFVHILPVNKRNITCVDSRFLHADKRRRQYLRDLSIDP